VKNAFLWLFIAFFTSGLHGQAQKPDFSGLWVMVSPHQGYQQLVTHDAATLTSRPPSGQDGPTVVYKLDGTQSRNVVKTEAGEAVGVSTVAWKGNQMEIASDVTWSTGHKLDQVQLWSLDDQGQLVIEFQSKGAEPMKMIFRQQSR
jgi:hypothetical protein